MRTADFILRESFSSKEISLFSLRMHHAPKAARKTSRIIRTEYIVCIKTSTFHNRTFVLSCKNSITYANGFVNTFVRFLLILSTLNRTLLRRCVLFIKYSTTYSIRQRFRQNLPLKKQKNSEQKEVLNCVKHVRACGDLPACGISLIFRRVRLCLLPYLLFTSGIACAIIL